jgi:hypothetical protein
MTLITQDLSRFGYQPLTVAAKLLKAYAQARWASNADQLGEEVALVFNTHSGLVFLSDGEFNAAVLNDTGVLENWLACSICGAEGLRSEVNFFDDVTCQTCAEQEAQSLTNT